MSDDRIGFQAGFPKSVRFSKSVQAQRTDARPDKSDISEVAAHDVSFREAFRVWVKVVIYSFGGPAGQIAVMHRLLVEKKRWVSENPFHLRSGAGVPSSFRIGSSVRLMIGIPPRLQVLY